MYQAIVTALLMIFSKDDLATAAKKILAVIIGILSKMKNAIANFFRRKKKEKQAAEVEQQAGSVEADNPEIEEYQEESEVTYNPQLKLSENFNMVEFTKSQTAERRNIKNIPGPAEIAALQSLVTEVLQPVRDHFKRPMSINSGYRSPELNAAIGGARTSQHTKGQAADIEIPGVANYDLAVWIAENLDFDQLILEFYDPAEGPNSGWVHVSYVDKGSNRKQRLTALKGGKYVNGFVK